MKEEKLLLETVQCVLNHSIALTKHCETLERALLQGPEAYATLKKHRPIRNGDAPLVRHSLHSKLGPQGDLTPLQEEQLDFFYSTYRA